MKKSAMCVAFVFATISLCAQTNQDDSLLVKQLDEVEVSEDVVSDLYSSKYKEDQLYHYFCDIISSHAGMMELVVMLDSKSSGLSRVGSSPTTGTNFFVKIPKST